MAARELPVERKTVKAMALLTMKRTHDMFAQNHGEQLPLSESSQRAKIACKLRDEYAAVKDLPTKDKRGPTLPPAGPQAMPNQGAQEGIGSRNADTAPRDPKLESKSAVAKLIDTMPKPADRAAETGKDKQLVSFTNRTLTVPVESKKAEMTSAAVSRRLASKWPKPVWHAPWKNYRVISSHLGWVRSIAFDPSNEWFTTGSSDRTIKIWETATGKLKLTLTGHIEQVTGLAVSPRHPYMFSCGLDKKVMCWDLEYNKVIRNYHGHLSGVYSLALHPALDILMSGGRDSVCRVWDMRTKLQIFCLTGHDNTVCSILSQATDPQVITGSHDCSIRLWDLRGNTTMSTLTYHKKSVRAMTLHPHEHAFASASADNIKKFRLPNGDFLHNMLQQQRTIVNAAAVNEDGVMVTGGDNGSLWFWDWTSGNSFQRENVIVQPGSLESEAGVFAMSFDATGSRLVTCEADKTIKMWKEDTEATPETHPVAFRPPRDFKRY
ncbi:unnamed protein product [Ostreobium quekettii]|uniref:Uncharacterized protein n=1 Tax=Ostreobium quekettii TaxID=121088 RepID=A0A8S1J4Z4_9CHLO|nr:unnamed protein product [Ostreobium quekettii]|eukprot:evm.model.scf_492.6 EVM.evm.TU.scf_492.6   scf_492:66791-72684(-)